MRDSKNKLLKIFIIILKIFLIDLGVCLLLTLLWFLSLNSTFNSYVFITGLVTILIAFLLSLVIIMIGEFLLFDSIVNFLRRKKGYEKFLNEDYFREYEKIKAIISPAFSRIKRKEVLNDVLEIMISAQEQGRNVKDVVGNSDEFAFNIIESYGLINPRWIHLLNGIMVSLCLLFGSHLGIWFMERMNFFNALIPSIFVILSILLGIVLFIISYNLKRRDKLKKVRILLYFIFGSFTLLLLISIIGDFYELPLFNYLFHPNIAVIPNVYVLSLYLFIIVATLLLNQYFRKKSLRQFIKNP